MLKPREVFALFLALCLITLALAAGAFAQDVPPAEAAAPIVDFGDLFQRILALPAVVAAVLAFAKHGMRFVPNKYLPYVGAAVALVVDVGTQILAQTNLTPAAPGVASAATAVVLGASATGLHQMAAAPRTAKQIEELEAELAAAKKRAGR